MRRWPSRRLPPLPQARLTLQHPSGKDAERKEQGSVNAKDPETERDGFVNHRSDSGQKNLIACVIEKFAKAWHALLNTLEI